MNLRQEVLAYSRSCERLLSLDAKLTDEERSLLEYYMNKLSRELLSDKPTVRRGDAETGPSNPHQQYKAEH